MTELEEAELDYGASMAAREVASEAINQAKRDYRTMQTAWRRLNIAWGYEHAKGWK